MVREEGARGQGLSQRGQALQLQQQVFNVLWKSQKGYIFAFILIYVLISKEFLKAF